MRCWRDYLSGARYVWSSWCHCHPIVSCFIKTQTALTFLVPAYPRCPGKEAIKRVSVCLLNDDSSCTFGGNLQSGSQFFQSGLNSSDPGVKWNPGVPVCWHVFSNVDDGRCRYQLGMLVAVYSRMTWTLTWLRMRRWCCGRGAKRCLSAISLLSLALPSVCRASTVSARCDGSFGLPPWSNDVIVCLQ